MAEAGELPIRVELQATMPTPEELRAYLELRKAHPTLGGKVTLGPLKLYTDGSLGGRTAALTRPYADDPATSGLPIFAQEELDELVAIAAEANLQVAVHAIGDRAIDMVMDSCEKAKRAQKTDCPPADHPCPNHPRWLSVLTRYRLRYSANFSLLTCIFEAGRRSSRVLYAWKTMARLGVPTAGIRQPVEPCNPLWGMQAITRRDQSGYREGWHLRSA